MPSLSNKNAFKQCGLNNISFFTILYCLLFLCKGNKYFIYICKKTKMKKLIVLCSVLLTSCSIPIFYQVYKTTPCENEKVENSGYVYEDANCMVFYDFWEKGGDIGFRLYNKTNENIYLNLEECFFVRNGIARDYYLNRSWGNSSSVGVSTSTSFSYSNSYSSSKSETRYDYSDLLKTNSSSTSNSTQNSLSAGSMNVSGRSVTYQEKNVICIPPQTSKRIQEYAINKTLYRFCELILYPGKKQIDTLRFTLFDSPIVFGNRIAYMVGNSDSLIRFENNFYVSEISNYPENEVIGYELDSFCKDDYFSNGEYIYVFKHESPLFFYHKYNKTNSYKH